MTGKENATGKLDDILADTDTEEVTIEYNGKTFWFEYKTSLTWDERSNIHQDNANIEIDEDTGDIDAEDIDLTGMQKDLLKAKIVDSSIDNINMMLQGGGEFIDKLIEEILTDEQAELGN